MTAFVNNLLNQLYFIVERLNWWDVVDLALVTAVFFAILLLLRGTQAMVLLRGVLLLIVLVSVYHMARYDGFPPFDKGSAAATLRYNDAIRRLAGRTGCLYADVYSAQARADWLAHQDTVHANKVGNLVIAHEIFRVLATHCSGLSKAVNEANEDTKWTRSIRASRWGTTRPAK